MQNLSIGAIHNDMISPTRKFKIFVDYSNQIEKTFPEHGCNMRVDLIFLIGTNFGIALVEQCRE